MTQPWTPLCLVPACDLERADWPLPVVVLAADGTARQEGQPVGLTRILPQVVAAVSLSAKGRAALTAAGVTPLHLSRSSDVAPTLIARLASALSAAETRIVRQSREMGQLRQTLEQSLQHFERLEAFAWQIGKGERNQVLHLPPQGDALEVTRRAAQRLPVDSTGLSDLAIWVGQPIAGELNLRLRLVDSDAVVAEWRLTDPAAGWLRLALPRALPADAQTPVIELEWDGAQPLPLGLSHDHPDPRYHCDGSRMLAVRLWKFLAGVTSPLAPQSLAPLTESARSRRLIGLGAMAEAAALGDPARVEFLDWAGGVILRPGPETPAMLRLPLAAEAGLCRFQGMAMVEGEAPAELAYALALPGQEPEPMHWQSMTPGEPTGLHILLPEPLGETHDLWLMARAGQGATSAIFGRIEGFATLDGHDH